MNRYLTPDEQAAYDKEMAQDAMRNAVYNDYNDVKAAHPDEIVLYQVWGTSSSCMARMRGQLQMISALS
mgnify:CR=1 FL=1